MVSFQISLKPLVSFMERTLVETLLMKRNALIAFFLFSWWYLGKTLIYFGYVSAKRSAIKSVRNFWKENVHPYLEGKQRILVPRALSSFRLRRGRGHWLTLACEQARKKERKERTDPSCFLFSPLRACQLIIFRRNVCKSRDRGIWVKSDVKAVSLFLILTKRKAGLRLPNSQKGRCDRLFFVQLVVSYKKSMYIRQGSPGKPIWLMYLKYTIDAQNKRA